MSSGDTDTRTVTQAASRTATLVYDSDGDSDATDARGFRVSKRGAVIATIIVQSESSSNRSESLDFESLAVVLPRPTLHTIPAAAGQGSSDGCRCRRSNCRLNRIEPDPEAAVVPPSRATARSAKKKGRAQQRLAAERGEPFSRRRVRRSDCRLCRGRGMPRWRCFRFEWGGWQWERPTKEH